MHRFFECDILVSLGTSIFFTHWVSKGAFRSKYPLTNDFMFKAVLQKNQTALKGLLCALLDMRMEEIAAIRILNPIEIGILAFTPHGFPEKLYLDYYFYNLDTAHKHSDKLSIRVLELNQLEKEE